MANQQDQRPNRKDFTKMVVIGPNAQVVPPQQWQGVLGNAKGRDLKRILKENHWSSTNYFDSEAYEKAVKEFREGAKSKTHQTRQTLFQAAFEEAGVQHHPRIESALRTVLPLMDPESQETRVIKALGKIVAAVDSVMVEAKRNPGKKNGNGRPNMDKVKEMNAGKEAANDGAQAKGGDSDQGKDQNGSQNLSASSNATAEQLEMIGKIKDQYDGEVDKAMQAEDMNRLAEVKNAYDIAVEAVMAGEQVTDMFSISGIDKSTGGKGGNNNSTDKPERVDA